MEKTVSIREAIRSENSTLVYVQPVILQICISTDGMYYSPMSHLRRANNFKDVMKILGYELE